MYKYRDSEEFRAKLYFLLGSILCTPFCMEALALLRRETEFTLWAFLLDLFFFVAGVYIICFSYSIMYERDEKSK